MKIQLWNDMEMQRYNYPTPPSTNEDSPVSVHILSPPSYLSESSSSPVDFQKQNYVFASTNFSVMPNQTFDNMPGEVDDIPPCLKMIEQPLDKFRFRYKSEMTGTHGSLNGENSDKTRKMTYPTVELCNYQGSAIVRCSIWQIKHNGDDFMPHAHRLVKKKHGKEETDDPHDLEVNKNTNYQATFHSMGIIHTAKKNIVGELIKKKTKLKRKLLLEKVD
ncbi:hypothetical protein HHI36_013067 [Cryptolaemus montrouzieri]|uniref:RHD domain-containing protein n=1 Tax=Cryptolaemus montrouzieri TaxID=559131 RepID=A0ABD2NG88_9CUCU